MSRRRAAVKRIVKPDTRFGSVVLAKFINNVTKSGKKSLAERLVYGSFSRISKKYGVDPFKTFTDAVGGVKPYVEVKSVRVGGANYQVPSPVEEGRGYALAMRWIIAAAVKRGGRSMIEKLAEELFDAAAGRGAAVKKRDDTYKMAEGNKAFAYLAQRSLQR